MPNVTRLQKSSQTRLFTIEDRANPGNAPIYQFLSRATGLSWPQGDITPIRAPDPAQYGQFKVIDSIRGQQGLPTISIEARMTRDLSDYLKLVRKQCAFDVQIHAGICEDPRDFNGGWDKIYVFESAQATDYTTGELGALDADQDVPVIETIPLSGEDYYELKRLNGAEIASAEVVQEVVDIEVIDSRQCGECGISSNGCEKVFAITVSAGASPGLSAEVIYSSDAGATIGETNVSTLAANENPSALAGVGIYLVVVSEASESLHYASLADILNGVEAWAEVTTGFVATKGPLAIFSLSAVATWIVGEGGYVYFSEDITAGVVVQSAGAATVNNLNAIHGVDEDNLVAVGAANTVLNTRDGGSVWASITGPAPGVVLNTVWMKTDDIWLVGTAGGQLFYTNNGGTTWTEIGFSGSGAGQVRDIKFSTPTVGYMAHSTAAPAGRVFRTIDGGRSWYALPEQVGLVLPTSDYIAALAACSEDPNLVFGGGLAGNGTDGVIIKIA